MPPANKKLKSILAELKKTQRRVIQLEKIDSMGRMALDIIHEIKMPLSIILAGVESLKAGLAKSDDRTKVALAKIKEASLRLDKTVKNLLEFSRLTKSGFEPSDINGIIDKALPLTQHQMTLANIKIKKDTAKDLPMVNANKNQLQQVMINLLLNAYAAIHKEGEIMIRTYTEKVTKAGNGCGRRSTDYFRIGSNVVKVRVEDTGCGIPKKKLSEIFDAFFSTNHDIMHMGIGLDISRTIIDNHKGTIEIDSKLNKGTRVTLTLPAIKKNIL